MTERCTACGAPLIWSNGQLTCPMRTCPGHGQRKEGTA